MTRSHVPKEFGGVDLYEDAQSIALIALGPRAKSRGELFTHLKKRGVTEDIANAVLYRLQEQGFIDDEAFARAWSESRQRAKKLSKRMIAGELREKGIGAEIIELVCSEIGHDAEYAIALEMAQRKYRPISHLDPEVARRRVHGALARRGFSSSLINDVLREIGL
ncbi:MAG: RecX family transcriptional regulator [Actinobacteria bacterium]|nr:RecX family transcriptional regulator [Actinomycetota bacterium]